MRKEIDTKKIEEHIREILIALGENPNREGLLETPQRVAKMYEEIFSGICYSNDDIAEMFEKTFTLDENITTGNMVVVKDIDIFSYCEHHMALIYDVKVKVGYIPSKKIIGLSKIARIADMVGRRLQVQERIGSDIAEIVVKVAKTQDVAVEIEAIHSCMTARGIKKSGAKTVTTTFCGRFLEDVSLQTQFLNY